LAPSDIFIFPTLKISWNVYCFESTENIQNNIFRNIVYINVPGMAETLECPGSSHEITRLDIRGLGGSSPDTIKILLLFHSVQIHSGANLVSNGYLVSSPRGKMVGAWSSSLISI
jgi:hypothetical protein